MVAIYTSQLWDHQTVAFLLRFDFRAPKMKRSQPKSPRWQLASVQEQYASLLLNCQSSSFVLRDMTACEAQAPPWPPASLLTAVPADVVPLHTALYQLFLCLLSCPLRKEQLRVQKEEWSKPYKVERWTTVPTHILMSEPRCKSRIRQLTAVQEISPLKYQSQRHRFHLVLIHARDHPKFITCKQHTSFCVNSVDSFESKKISIPEHNIVPTW